MRLIKKYKWGIAVAAVVVTALVVAFVCGGSLSPNEAVDQAETAATVAAVESSAVPSTATDKTVSGSTAASQPPTAKPSAAQASTAASTTAPQAATAARTTEPPKSGNTVTAPPQSAVSSQASQQKQSSKSNSTVPPATVLPKPVEPETKVITDNKGKCSLTISCASLLSHLDGLNEDTAALVPSDGLILFAEEESFNEGENVFDVLKRVCKRRNIHMEYTTAPIYNSAYIEGIGNLYEFDCGSGSGWMYRVNGVFPNYGCSRYAVKDGDKIEWLYTCDLGRDIGGYGIQYSE